LSNEPGIAKLEYFGFDHKDEEAALLASSDAG
jgi:hypothetical protein